MLTNKGTEREALLSYYVISLCESPPSNRFDGHGHFQSLFEMGSEEDAALLREVKERKSEGVEEHMGEGEAEERKKGEKGWRYGAVSRRRPSMGLQMDDGSRGGRAQS